MTLMALKPVAQRNAHGGTGKYTLPAEHLVVFGESLKLVVCSAGLLLRRAAGAPTGLTEGGFAYSIQFAAPAAVYVVMNFVTYHTNTYLDPPTFQFLANLK